jgi:hypothetical protein
LDRSLGECVEPTRISALARHLWIFQRNICGFDHAAAPPGRRTVKTEPLPGSLAKVTSPPIMRASLREMARPSPVLEQFRLLLRLDGGASGSPNMSLGLAAPVNGVIICVILYADLGTGGQNFSHG